MGCLHEQTDRERVTETDEKELESLAQSLIQAGFTHHEIATLHQALQQAFHNEVPISAATDKVREGVAKHVPAAMINQA